ncbi:hypothetical protein L7F22_002605 [Adiantum nelumboides]|nr:hypothetical protein [Adiantum nelumboides]
MCMHGRVPADMAFTGQLLSSLPDDVIEKIFALLPLQAKLVCRCVCRSWNSILSTDSLVSHTSNTDPRSSRSASSNACLMLTTRGPVAYTLDPLTNFWHGLSKPACPGASILAASHGLVCVGNQVSECRSLLIFNLLSKTWRLLPNMLHVGLLHKVTMAMDPSSYAYIIIVTGEDTSKFRGRSQYRLRTEVYDSVSALWRMAKDALPEAKFGSDPGVWHNGVFYCITEMPYGLTAFSLAEGRWMELSVEMPTSILHPSLVSCKGQLMMVGIQVGNANCKHCAFDESSVPTDVQPAEHLSSLPWQTFRSSSWSSPLQLWVRSQLHAMLSGWSSRSLSFPLLSASLPLSGLISPLSSPPAAPETVSLAPSLSQLKKSNPKKCIRVWSLVNCKQWLIMDEMPKELCTDFMTQLTDKTPLVCAGVGDYICISSHQSPNAVTFNVKDMCWRYVASDPLFPKNRDTHLLGFAVLPDSLCVP